jgi:sigma-B regulation protein RsbU (phosphoserine phosphatase)
MKSDLAHTNVSFDFLKGSGTFLNLILENISSCVILLNNHMELQAYNNALKTMFSNKKDEEILYHRCGEVIGCAYQVEEATECGRTTQCSTCDLRISALNCYSTNKEVFKEYFTRPFYTSALTKVEKHLQFSVRIFAFENERYILMIIDDISRYIESKETLKPYSES